MPVGEVYVLLVEDGSPLERGLYNVWVSVSLAQSSLSLQQLYHYRCGGREPTPWSRWQVLQWQYLLASGLSLLS